MKTSADWRRSLARVFPGAVFDEPLSRHTTFKIGGPADCYAEPANAEELRALVGASADAGLPLRMIGMGSNLLVLDGGVRGIVARLKGDFETLNLSGGSLIQVGAGVRMPKMIAWAGERGLGGAEYLAGIPGTAGGALVMNAGTKEGEIGALVLEVSVLDRKTLSTQALSPAEAAFSYRSSRLDPFIVLGALLQLKPGERDGIIERIQGFQHKRLVTQPVHTFNVGSVFKNPPGLFVGKLLEDVGLKGLRIGGARISPKHANFIENVEAAKASDVLELVRIAREKAMEKYSVALELEVRTIGEP